ncbi:hypothetical protein V5O48_004968 [Marasmius crinis-equi]|uniref:Matrin-type domain-containing protein n=1 Tax=Marasmius crinis-equi TaxID=585013 RepID=A0ABR3FNX1_9AGAR
MSEYWVSKKRYYCKYCEIYIADDAPSRQQHENGLRHKGNRDRFIRGLYKEGEKKKKDQEEEKREMARVERAAQAAFSQDVGEGRAKAIAPVASSSSGPKKAPTKPSDPYANYSSAASLGYTDPDAERIAAELARKQTQGVAGEWQVVESVVATSESSSSAEPETETGTVPQKRPAEAPIDPEDTRHFKLQKRTLGIGLGQIYDPGAITLKLKKKEPSVADVSMDTVKEANASLAPTEELPKSGEKPKWTKIQWKRPEDKGSQDSPVQAESIEGEPAAKESETAAVKGALPDSEVGVKREQENGDMGLKVENEVSGVTDPRQSGEAKKEEPAEEPIGQASGGGSLFKKRRKIPNAGKRT